MKISDMITMLQAATTKHGDLDIKLMDEHGNFVGGKRGSRHSNFRLFEPGYTDTVDGGPFVSDEEYAAYIKNGANHEEFVGPFFCIRIR